jgi:hypothetical protein
MRTAVAAYRSNPGASHVGDIHAMRLAKPMLQMRFRGPHPMLENALLGYGGSNEVSEQHQTADLAEQWFREPERTPADNSPPFVEAKPVTFPQEFPYPLAAAQDLRPHAQPDKVIYHMEDAAPILGSPMDTRGTEYGLGPADSFSSPGEPHAIGLGIGPVAVPHALPHVSPSQGYTVSPQQSFYQPAYAVTTIPETPVYYHMTPGNFER